MNLLLFEDSFVSQLEPITTGRPAFAQTCGSYQLIELVRPFVDERQDDGSVALDVRPILRDIVAADYPEFQVLNDSADHLSASSISICVNARLAPTIHNMVALKNLAERFTGEQDSAAFLVGSDGKIAAAFLPTDSIPTWRNGGYQQESLPGADATDEPLQMIEHLHDLVKVNCGAFNDNLQHRLETESWHEIANGVFARDKESTLGPQVVADTSPGPILIEPGYSIGSFTYLEGPLYLGPNCKIAAHSAIKECVSTGTTCKLGGEIEATVIESFTNKQHHGFLGHAYLGSWINLGAGTCNSDLKNTYGKVNMVRDGQKVSTGMQFVGCFIGDYAKTAINTSIFTGKTIGVASMVYGFATNDVPAFTNDSQIHGKRTVVDPVVMIQTQKRMFGRRNVIQRDVDIDLVHSMFESTKSQRSGLSNEPLVF